MRNTLTSVLVIALFASGCTFLVDRNGQQCSTDADCVKFGGHPACISGVCTPSGLGPDGCFVGTPQMQGDYLNALHRIRALPTAA